MEQIYSWQHTEFSLLISKIQGESYSFHYKACKACKKDVCVCVLVSVVPVLFVFLKYSQTLIIFTKTSTVKLDYSSKQYVCF